MQVLRIINEPTAAALAYGMDKKEDGKTIAVGICDVLEEGVEACHVRAVHSLKGGLGVEEKGEREREREREEGNGFTCDPW